LGAAVFDSEQEEKCFFSAPFVRSPETKLQRSLSAEVKELASMTSVAVQCKRIIVGGRTWTKDGKKPKMS
jgi:hypothetical protein